MSTVNPKLKTAGIISLIIYILYTIVMLIALAASGMIASFLPASLGGMVVVIVLVLAALSIMGLIGSVKIMKGKGRMLYLIPTFVFVLLGLLGIIGGITSGQVTGGSVFSWALWAGLTYSLITVLKNK